MGIEAFRDELESQFARAEALGAKYVDIVSGNLHRAVGGYPGTSHSMPSCCNAMYHAQRAGEEVLAAPPKGKGATLKIRFRLPRL